MAKTYDVTEDGRDIESVDSTTSPDQLCCGNCGVDYRGMTVADLAEMANRRPCLACRSYLYELTDWRCDLRFVDDES